MKMAVGRQGLFIAFLLAVLLAVSTAVQEPGAAAAQPPKAPHVKTPEVKVPTPKAAPELKSPPANVPPTPATMRLEIGSKKILVLLPVAAPSHHNVFSALISELLDRGHYVTIVSSRPQNAKHPRQREILFPDPFEPMLKKLNVHFLTKSSSSFEKVFMMYVFGATLNGAVLKNPEALALKEEHFDLVIVETFFFQEGLLGFAHHFRCPAMTVNPFGYTNLINEFTGGATNPAYVPNIFAGATAPVTFLDRFTNTITTIFSFLTYHLYWYPQVNAMMHEAFPDAPPLYDLMTNVSLTLINNHPSLMPTVALSPSVIEVGGLHIKPGKPLPADLKKWVEDSKDGIVYFSLGSNIRPGQMPPEKRDAIFASFAKLKQRVLVKWDTKLIPPNPPANCRFEDWIPQQEILAHPKLRVFVSHGGLLSSQESVYFGAAVVGMPIFGDQDMNMQVAVQQGFGRMVSYFNLTTEDLDAALNEVINNPKYREHSRKMSVRFRSEPIPPLEKAVYYTELLLKLGDLNHLLPASVHLHWYQYLLLDVMAVLALGLYVSWRIIRFVCSVCFGCCCRSSKTKKD